jgi:DDE family transposase
MHVDICAANLNDHKMLQDMVDGIQPIRQPAGRPRKRPAKLHADKGYAYPGCRELLRERNIIARIARPGIESSRRLGRHRYVIERCLEWTTRFRRLVRRYERKASHFAELGHDPGFEERLHQREHLLVLHPCSDPVHQGRVVDTVKARLDIRVQHPSVTGGGQMMDLGDSVVRAPVRPEPI